MANKLSREKSEILIELVSQQRFVYDPKERDHKDAPRLANFWSSVAKELNVPGLAGEDVKIKWKGIRDGFMKAKRSQTTRSGQGLVSTPIRYCWATRLAFLDDVTDTTRTDTNMMDARADDLSQSLAFIAEDGDAVVIEGESNVGDEYSCGGAIADKDDDVTDRLNVGLAPNTFPRPKALPKKRRRSTSPSCADDMLINKLLHDFTKTQNDINQDAEETFHAACAKRAKCLPSQIRAVLQVQITQLLYNAENQHLLPMPITPLPQSNNPEGSASCSSF